MLPYAALECRGNDSLENGARNLLAPSYSIEAPTFASVIAITNSPRLALERRDSGSSVSIPAARRRHEAAVCGSSLWQIAWTLDLDQDRVLFEPPQRVGACNYGGA